MGAPALTLLAVVKLALNHVLAPVLGVWSRVVIRNWIVPQVPSRCYVQVTYPLLNGSRRYDKPPWVVRDFPDLKSRVHLLRQELAGRDRQDGPIVTAAVSLASHDSQVRDLPRTLRIFKQRVVQDDSGDCGWASASHVEVQPNSGVPNPKLAIRDCLFQNISGPG